MERRAASHTEEEEMNQRRRLLNSARKGDTKAISKLFELYQVRIYSGEMLSKLNRTLASGAASRLRSNSKKSAKVTHRAKPTVTHRVKPRHKAARPHKSVRRPKARRPVHYGRRKRK
jgi:hypothetical protein